jgi:Protein of unknown function (DUF3617)
MSRLDPAVLLLALLLVPLSGNAQTPIKLKSGAWEVTTESDAAAPADMLAKMPPQMQEMMKQKMAEATAKARAPTRVCVTPNDDDYRKAMLERMGANIKCNHGATQRSGSTYAWTSSCVSTHPGAGTGIKIDSEHTMRYDGGNDWTHTAKTRSEGMAGAGPTTRTSSSKGHYLGSDCKAFGALTLEEQMKDAENRARPRAERPMK